MNLKLRDAKLKTAWFHILALLLMGLTGYCLLVLDMMAPVTSSPSPCSSVCVMDYVLLSSTA